MADRRPPLRPVGMAGLQADVLSALGLGVGVSDVLVFGPQPSDHILFRSHVFAAVIFQRMGLPAR